MVEFPSPVSNATFRPTTCKVRGSPGACSGDAHGKRTSATRSRSTMPPPSVLASWRRLQEACKFSAYAAPAFSGRIVRSLRLGSTAFNITLKRMSAKVAKYEQPLPDGFDPEGKLKNKGFLRAPTESDTAFASFLQGASGPLRGALVVRALSYKVRAACHVLCARAHVNGSGVRAFQTHRAPAPFAACRCLTPWQRRRW